MAVFLINSCKFNDCGLVFQSLGDLIQHIEDVHIASDLRTLEKLEQQQPANIACSYVLRFFGDLAQPSSLPKKKLSAVCSAVPPIPAAGMQSLHGCPPPLCNETPNSSDNGEGDAESEAESNDSWVAQQEFAAQLILSMMSSKDSEMEKPFRCPIPGCSKRYKNINGVKYHARHGHRKHDRLQNVHKCFCGKRYHSQHSLLNHTNLCHASVLPGASQGTAPLPTASPSAASSGNSSIGYSAPPALVGNGTSVSRLLVLPSVLTSRSQTVASVVTAAADDY